MLNPDCSVLAHASHPAPLGSYPSLHVQAVATDGSLPAPIMAPVGQAAHPLPVEE